MSIIAILLGGLFGILAGGIANALADYLPAARLAATGEADATGRPLRPHYPDGSVRQPGDWLALLAFAARRRASPGGAQLGWRHPLVEAGLGIVCALIVGHYGWSGQTLFNLVVVAILALITVIDVEHRLILLAVILPACLVALLRSLFAPPPAWQDALLGGGLGFLLFFVMYLGGLGFSRLMRTDAVAFGFGDVMLGTLSGMLLGWRLILLALILAIFLGAAGSLLYLLGRLISRRRYSLFTALPYGPYIVLATVLIMFWRDEIRALLIG